MHTAVDNRSAPRFQSNDHSAGLTVKQQGLSQPANAFDFLGIDLREHRKFTIYCEQQR